MSLSLNDFKGSIDQCASRKMCSRANRKMCKPQYEQIVKGCNIKS